LTKYQFFIGVLAVTPFKVLSVEMIGWTDIRSIAWVLTLYFTTG